MVNCEPLFAALTTLFTAPEGGKSTERGMQTTTRWRENKKRKPIRRKVKGVRLLIQPSYNRLLPAFPSFLPPSHFNRRNQLGVLAHFPNPPHFFSPPPSSLFFSSLRCFVPFELFLTVARVTQIAELAKAVKFYWAYSTQPTSRDKYAVVRWRGVVGCVNKCGDSVGPVNSVEVTGGPHYGLNFPKEALI